MAMDSLLGWSSAYVLIIFAVVLHVGIIIVILYQSCRKSWNGCCSCCARNDSDETAGSEHIVTSSRENEGYTGDSDSSRSSSDTSMEAGITTSAEFYRREYSETASSRHPENMNSHRSWLTRIRDRVETVGSYIVRHDRGAARPANEEFDSNSLPSYQEALRRQAYYGGDHPPSYDDVAKYDSSKSG